LRFELLTPLAMPAVPWVRDVLNWLGKGITAILTAWLPTVALVIFMAVSSMTSMASMAVQA
jgi:hypothetical protein